MQNNNLVGTIPPQIFNGTGTRRKLWSLDLSSNSITGPLPSSDTFLLASIALTSVNVAYNKLTGSVPGTLASLPNLGNVIGWIWCSMALHALELALTV